uniref:adenylate kinase n=2 Tax=Vitis vinifera TaxID=29760 RepID=F6I2X6_VITVI
MCYQLLCLQKLSRVTLCIAIHLFSPLLFFLFLPHFVCKFHSFQLVILLIGSQCPLIVKQFRLTHLSAGDLLQAEIELGSENGKMIQDYKKEGKIVPSEVTVKLLQQAMQGSTNNKFLIDGFPCNEENRTAFENIMKVEPDFVLFFDCSQEELTRRILNRNQGRVDDNIQAIPKRFQVYFESTLPVIDYYSSKGKVQKIDAERSIEEVFEAVKSIFLNFSGGSGEGN